MHCIKHRLVSVLVFCLDTIDMTKRSWTYAHGMLSDRTSTDTAEARARASARVVPSLLCLVFVCMRQDLESGELGAVAPDPPADPRGEQTAEVCARASACVAFAFFCI